MAEARLKTAENLAKEKTALFEWNQEAITSPYYKQGNRKHESAGVIEQRNKLKHSSVIREIINRFWQLVPKNILGRIGKQDYINLCLRLNKFLIPDISLSKSLSVIQEDWENDSEDSLSLTYAGFYNTLFTLAEVWADEISPLAYADFLSRVYRRITCKRKGNFKEFSKVLLVFPEELNQENE